MSLVSRMFSLCRNLIRRRRVERDLNDEVSTMFDLLVAEKIRSGTSPQEARRAAILEFGSVEGVKDQIRDAKAGMALSALFQDVRFGLRVLLHNPVFTATTAMSLGVGIGMITAAFVIVRAAFLQSWPAREPNRLVAVTSIGRQGSDPNFSYTEYRQLSSQTDCFSGLAAYTRHVKFILNGNEPRSVLDEFVSENYFSTLGVRAAVGRTFEPIETFDQPVAVISDVLWRRQFGGNPSLIGSPIVLSGRQYIVLGVLPSGFRGLQRGVPTDIWIPFDSDPVAADLVDSTQRAFQLIGRLKAGVTAAQARAELNVLAHELEPHNGAATTLTVVSEAERLRQVLPAAVLLMAAVGLVLLISCANVAGLVLARGEARRNEIAMRLALGAARDRIVRQLLTEGLMIAVAGGVVGILVGWFVLQLEPAVLPPMPVEVGLDLHIDWAIVLFTSLISFATVVVFGLFPALQASRTSLLPALKGVPADISRHLSARNVFVVAEISLAVVLVSVAMLLQRSLLHLEAIPLGIDDANQQLVFFDVLPGLAGYHGQRSRQFFGDAADRLRSIPGLEQISFAVRVPLSASGGGAERSVSIPDLEPRESRRDGLATSLVKFNAVGPNYFETIGTRILMGRTFSHADFATAAQSVVIVSRTMRRRSWPQVDPVGRHIMIGGADHEIVGIAEDVKINDVHENPEPYVYVVFGEATDGEGTLILRATGDIQAIIDIARERLHALDSNVPVTVRTMDDLRRLAYYQEVITTELALALGMLAVFLALVGVYGVTAHWITRRRHEIGVRMALGAGGSRIIRLVVAQGFQLALAGIAIGLILTVSLGQVISRFLYGFSPTDPRTLAMSGALVMIVALSATAYPAFRASRLDPLIALRCE